MISTVIEAALEVIEWVFLLVMVVCIWETGKALNEVPDKHKIKPVLAWDTLVLVISLIIIVMNMAKG